MKIFPLFILQNVKHQVGGAELNADFLQLSFFWRWNALTTLTTVTLFNFTGERYYL